MAARRARAAGRARCGASACSCTRHRTSRKRRRAIGGVPARPAEAGWAVGRNMRIDTRWSGSDAAAFAQACGGIGRARAGRRLGRLGPTVAALQQATPHRADRVRPSPSIRSAPAMSTSLARPGGNATGFTAVRIRHERQMAGAAQGDRAAASRAWRSCGIPASPPGSGSGPSIQAVAPSLGMELSPISVRDAAEIERGIAAFARGSNGGLIVAVERGGADSSRADRHACGAAQAARGLSLPLLRRRRRPDLLWARSARPVPARGRLRRSHPEGREAGRPAGAGADQVRAGRSTSRPPRRSASPCRHPCSPAPTR